MFSRRLPADAEVNALTQALTALASRGQSYIDLTESNPTRVGLHYPQDLLRPLADARALHYDPQPLGLAAAREAVAGESARRGVLVDPAHVVLTASTSEAYSWLFKLLCDPGDRVLVPRPSYPLFEHLARLEDVRLVPYDLQYQGRWEIDVEAIARAPGDTRAVLIVSPNNPTGSFVTDSELARLGAVCRERGWALVADEVFADYALEHRGRPVTDLATQAHLGGVLSFTLGGASKSLGLPQLKLGWMVVGGPPAARDAALAHLELIADTYLSVGTAVQVAAPSLLRDAAGVRQRIQERIGSNLRQARHLATGFPACDLLPVEGGWSAVVRVPATRSEEQLVLDLLDRERVLVHPGYFFDFPHEAFIVVSLLPPGDAFEDALSRVLRAAQG